MTSDPKELETTLLIIKPDAIRRRLMGRILQRLEEKGLQIVGLKMSRIAREQAEKQYSAHVGKHFYEPLVNFMSGGPVVAVALRGKSAIQLVRTLIGKTNCLEAHPGTIRGDFGISNRFNLVHASDCPESAKEELSLFFSENELETEAFADIDIVYDTSTGEFV